RVNTWILKIPFEASVKLSKVNMTIFRNKRSTWSERSKKPSKKQKGYVHNVETINRYARKTNSDGCRGDRSRDTDPRWRNRDSRRSYGSHDNPCPWHSKIYLAG